MDVSRYVNTEKIDFTVEFLTPCFLGGADQNAEVRVAPFKAGLRYWWRVLYGQKYGDKLKSVEDEIFGTAKSDNKTGMGKSRVIWELTENKCNFAKENFKNPKPMMVSHTMRDKVTGAPFKKTFPVNPLDYLAYGKNEYSKEERKNVYKNTYIKAGSTISFHILIAGTHLEEVKDALKFFITYGGVGSRSRNGFGSMYSKEISDLAWSGQIVVSDKVSEYPVLSIQSGMYVEKQNCSDWEFSLSQIGTYYHDVRGSLERKHNYEKRSLISRPIEVKGEDIPAEIRKQRFPKDIFMGITKSGNGVRGYIIILPIKFYHQSEQQDYCEVIKKIKDGFASVMNENTSEFVKMIGGTK